MDNINQNSRRQFFIFKFSSSWLKEKKYNVSLTFDEAISKNKVIAIADSEMLRLIRKETGQTVDFEEVENLYLERDIVQKKKNAKEYRSRVKKIQNRIYEILYVPEYITIFMESKTDYKHLFMNGLILNGKKYVRTSCSASQGRVSTVVFVEENVSKEILKKLDNGRDRSKKLVPSKYNAYLGTASSATKIVSTPRVCIIKDCIQTRDTKINWVTEVENKWDDDIIEEKTIPIEFNLFDGNGLISPKKAKEWAKELGLNYLPAQWCIRANFTKGMVSVFDFVEFCKEYNNNSYVIYDLYGVPYDLREVDVILTESQFKLWDSFNNYSEYEENCLRNGLNWGVSLYTKEKDKDVLWLNYQFIQTLNLSDNDIIALCKDTVDYFNNISYDDVESTIKFCLGAKTDEKAINDFLRSSDNYWLKSLIINNDMINDKFIRQKIYNDLVTKMKNACMGRIFVDGNFQVIVPDSFAFMEHACGLPVKGLLDVGNVYSKYWIDKHVDVVDSMRSPLTHISEHNIINIKNSSLMAKWFKYYYTGIVVNVHGDDTIRWAGADFDFDILATTSNKIMIDGVYKNENPITYQPPKAEKIDITPESLYKSDIFTFGSEIGTITNKITICYSLLPLFKKGSKEYEILMNRIKMGCKLQSAQIDKAKIGKNVKGIPKGWIQYVRPEGENKKAIEINNSLLCSNKHPYFFIYLYKNTKNSWNKYYKEHDAACINRFGVKLAELIAKDQKTKDENLFLERFEKSKPVLDTSCEMNRLCHYMEGVSKSISNKSKWGDDSFYNLMINHEVPKDLYVYERIKTVLQSFKKALTEFNMTDSYAGKDKNYISTIYNKDNAYREFVNNLDYLSSNRYEITNCLVEIFYKEFISYDKNILWDNYGKYIFNNIKENSGLSTSDEGGEFVNY